MLRSLKNLSRQDLEGKRVLIRVDFNVPFDEKGAITDDTRIRAAMPSIAYCLNNGAQVLVTSHLGRPIEGEIIEEKNSLKSVTKRVAELIWSQKTAIHNIRNVRIISDWLNGDDEDLEFEFNTLMILENCRQYVGEKENSRELAEKIIKKCKIDVFVNDAFGTAHRAEATTVGVAEFVPISCAGLLLTKEINALTSALNEGKRPLVAIVGGSKISTKLTVLKNLAHKVDQLIVGGGIANTFLLAKGFNVGKSLVEENLVTQACEIMDIMEKRGASIPLPIDVICGKQLKVDQLPEIKNIEDVDADDCIFDVGPKTSALFAEILKKAQMIVWNGPVGVFEYEQFSSGTKLMTLAISESSAFSIAGGGDTIAAVNKFDGKVSYISTGGGAFLEFLEGKDLPAIAVLTD